jgi:excisionase family DNA binding protein
MVSTSLNLSGVPMALQTLSIQPVSTADKTLGVRCAGNVFSAWVQALEKMGDPSLALHTPITIEEFASFTRVSKRTVKRLISIGILRPLRIGRTIRLIPADTLNQLKCQPVSMGVNLTNSDAVCAGQSM